MGSTAVLLKMDYLLHKGAWGRAQNLADQFAPYVQHSKNESSFLASRAVAWEHQKQFSKALAAYQQIDDLQPKSPPAGYVAPDYSFIEAELKDSVKVNSQAPETIASSQAATHLASASQLEGLPKKFSVGHSYPNPFNPTTIIPISLPKSAHVHVTVYNVIGQLVATLANREFQAGTYDLRFNADQLASGVYFIRARLGEKLFTTRVTLIK
jgi:tetratricopeptide (TPR) repeat protein